MRRLLVILFLMIVPSAILLSQEERIYTHHSDIVVDTSGVVRVSEKIKIFAQGNLFKRGITRALPLRRTDVEGRRVKIEYAIRAVRKDGEEEPFFTEREGASLVLYIGEKGKNLSPGFYEYEIVYESAGQIGFFEEHDELGWNVNGTSDRRVDQVSCQVQLPQGATIVSSRCYTGVERSTESNCTSESMNETLFRASASNLQPNEMLTVYVGFEKGVVHQPVVKETTWSRFLSWLDKMGLWFMNLIIFVPLAFYYVLTWRKHGVNYPRPVVVPQFAPPNNMSPASVGMIYYGGYNERLVSTSIVNMAVKGFIRIEEIERKGVFSLAKKRYKLVKLKEADNNLHSEERVIMNDLFNNATEVYLKGKYNSKIENMMLGYQVDMEQQHLATLAEGQNIGFMVLPFLVLVGYIVLLFYYGRHVPMELFLMLLAIAFPVFIVAAIVQGIMAAVKRRRPKKLISISLGIAVMVSVIGAFLYFPYNRLSTTDLALLIGLPTMVIGYLIYSHMIVRRSKERLQMEADIEGLKMYMSLAEEKQLQYFNPPEVTPEIFEKLLPYAIALKMEKIWGEKFERALVKSMQTREAYVPMWYAGTVLRPIDMGNALSYSLASNMRQGATAPTSSGGKWSSGSFGGGFSGGGGGGGSTGGW